LNTKDLALVALFTALIVVFGLVPPVPVPWVPVPITLQTFGVMLAGLILGPRRAGLVLLLYVGVALVGLPVLPGFRAGLVVLAGPTGGFLLGMIPGAVVVGWLASRFSVVVASDSSKKMREVVAYILASMVGAILIVYAVGVPWLSAVTGMGLQKAALAVVVFLPGDILKAIVAALVAQRVRRLGLV